jgi:hypothetical protein
MKTTSIKIVVGMIIFRRKNGSSSKMAIANSTPIKNLERYAAVSNGIPIGSNWCTSKEVNA